MSHASSASADMHLQNHATKSSWIMQIDPRARVVTTFLFACVVVSLESFLTLGLSVAVSIFLLLSARLPAKATLKKVMTMDGFILFMLCMLPFTTPGDEMFALAGVSATWQGLELALTIMLKANAIVLALLALVGTLEATVLGHALSRLKVPANLIHLMLFSVRYIDVLKQEYTCLRTAMRARCFKPANTLHTYRSIGYLVGMLLVRSLERSERILKAMKCRGFNGSFYILTEFHFQQRDRLFCVISLLVLLAMLGVEQFYG